MSNTRRVQQGSERSDERYASDPLLCKGHSKVYAHPVRVEPQKTISAPIPERDSGAALVVTPDRKNKRSASASLSPA
jgi:hypothetical protein